MQDLDRIRLERRLPIFINNFLADQTFNVHINNISDSYNQKMGILLGSICNSTQYQNKQHC